jgi:hypothetical protein
VDEAANPKVYLSVYTVTRSQFVADATIQALNAEIQQDQAEELARVYNAKQIERQAAGDDLTTAQAAGAAVQLQAIYRLLRARVRRLMLRDTVMVQSLGVNGPAVMKSGGTKSWKMKTSLSGARAPSRPSRCIAGERC